MQQEQLTLTRQLDETRERLLTGSKDVDDDLSPSTVKVTLFPTPTPLLYTRAVMVVKWLPRVQNKLKSVGCLKS